MGQDVRLTAGEKARIAGLSGRACKRLVAGEDVYIDDLTGRIDAITEQAAQRTARENDALLRQLDSARGTVADAAVAARTAGRDTKAQAKQQLKDAQAALTRTERAARRMGL